MAYLAWLLIILGAVFAYVFAAVIKNKEFESEEIRTKYYYIVKIIGLWLVIIGAFLVFKESGSFSIKKF